MAQSEEAAAGRRPSRRQLVVRLLLAVVVIAVVYLWLLPKLVDVSQVWATLRAMTWLELATLLVAAVWNLVSYMLPQLAALPGLSLGQAALESHTSTAVGNLLPAGIPTLNRLYKRKNGCGFLGLGDCYECIRPQMREALEQLRQ